VVPRLLPDMAMALARLRSPAHGWHASTHARCTRLTGHRARHTGKALVLTHVRPFFAQMPNTNQQGLYEISENETNEMPMREKMAKNTTGDMSVWRSPPLSIYRADATSPRALPTSSPKWTVLRPASPSRPAAVTTTVSATAELATPEFSECEHGFEDADNDHAAGEWGKGAMGAAERHEGTSVGLWPLYGTYRITPGSLDTNKQVAHVKFANTHISEPEPANLHGSSYGCILPRVHHTAVYSHGHRRLAGYILSCPLKT